LTNETTLDQGKRAIVTRPH